MKKKHLVLVGKCKDCGADVPLLTTNKGYMQEAWRCLKCNAINDYGQMKGVCYWSAKTVKKKLGISVGS